MKYTFRKKCFVFPVVGLYFLNHEMDSGTQNAEG
jgi:hypothetical protein